MEIAHQTARRRVGRILDHVAAAAPSDEALPPSPLLFPMNCSSTLNTTIVQRRDSRLLFARQGSYSRAQFMQEFSNNQDITPNSSSQSSNLLPKGSSQHSGEPLFSRKAKAASIAPGSVFGSSMKQDTLSSSSDAPLFARGISETIAKQQSTCSRRRQPSNGMEWSPRMDIAESRAKYVVTIELPGVRATDIQVEVDNERLMIMGKRSSNSRVANGCKGQKPTYHQREILEGPYRVVWPLPKNVNKDCTSAELSDGFLRITLPKL